MESRRTGDFEFKLGKFGLILFTFAVSLLLLASFIFGVIVGKNIDSYPEKIARGIPETIKNTITPGTAETAPKRIEDQGERKAEKPKSEKKGDEFNLTFYDTLTDKAKKTPQTTQGMTGEYVYTIQVASFRERVKTEALASRLKKLKLSPVIDKVSLTSSGTWYRVKLEGFPSHDEAKKKSQFMERRIRGLKCLIIKNKR